VVVDQSEAPWQAGSDSRPATRLAEAEAVEKPERLRAIFEIAKILVTEGEQETMLSDLLEALIDTLEAADAGSLWVYDPSEESLIAKGAVGYDKRYFLRMRLAPGEAISGKAYLSGRPELYPTPETTAEAMANMTPENMGYFVQSTVGLAEPLSAICVPLGIGDARLGALALLNLRQPGGFTSADLDFLVRVADLVFLAIENARLRSDLEAAQALSEANRLKAEVISVLAHEMRTPLTSIKGYSTALLMEETTFSPETQREFLQIIDEECDVLQDLIHDLLESSIIDAGLLRLEYQPVQLRSLARSITEDFARRSTVHRFLVDFSASFPIVDADPDRISQVLRNLLDNAVKYSPEGGLVIVRGEERADEVVVSVADQGPGIAPEHLNRLFEKFFRAKTGLGHHVVGSGLGLPIAHSIIESHGGRIWADSTLGQGTTLYFTLPRRDPGRVAAEE
jgi:signal transduction histidine kinase